MTVAPTRQAAACWQVASDLAEWAAVMCRSDPAASGFRQPLDAIERRELRTGARVPAKRTLAAAVRVSRGTVVACFEHPPHAGSDC